MEFGAATATLTKKLSNGYGVSGRSAYDGVFAAPIKLRAPSFSSQFDDYREIFGGSGVSLGSSIPILELPELNERKAVDDVRRSKLDYSKVFGGFGNLAGAVPFEELVAAPKQKNSFTNGAPARSKVKVEHQSLRKDRPNYYSNEIPVVSQSSDGAKRINMSYHKVNQGSENGTNGTTHIAQIHAVPAYTHLIEEVNTVKLNRANQPIPAAQVTNSGNHCDKEIKEGGRCTKSFTATSPNNGKKQSSYDGVKVKNRSNSVDQFFDACEINSGSNGTQPVKVHPSFTGASPESAKKQSPNDVVKVKNRTNSVDMFFDACEVSSGNDGTHDVKVHPSETMGCNFDNRHGDAMRSMPIKCQTSKSGTYEGAASNDSPSYFDDMVDSNSEAAASVAALRKAIEEAQVRMKVAKESMRRKKEGFPDRVKLKSYIDLKAEGKKEGKHAYKTMKIEEMKVRQTFAEMDALPRVSYEVRKPTMRMEQVRSDLGCAAEVAVREEQKKLKSTQAEHNEEIEQNADNKGKVLELKAAENNKKSPFIENTGNKVSDKQEEFNHTIEVVKEYWEQKNNEEKVRVDSEAGACEVFHETQSTCQEVVDETRPKPENEEILDNGTADKTLKLKINEDGEVENMISPFHEPEDSESNLGGQGLAAGNERKVACDPEEDHKKVERYFQLDECKNKLGAIEELEEAEKNIAQEQIIGSEDKVEVSSELEECELTEFLKPTDNERACSQHGSDLPSMEKGIENVGCVEDRRRRDESGFLDIYQGTEHSCQKEATDHMFSNINMQEILEDILDNVHDVEEIYERTTEDSGLEGNGRGKDAQASENELDGASQVMEENEREGLDNKVPIDIIRVTQNDPNYEEIKAAEASKTTETSSSYEPAETETLRKTRVAGTIIDNDETLDVTWVAGTIIEENSDVHDDIKVASNDSSQLQEKREEPESVQETNEFCEEHADQTSAFIEGSLKLNEAVNEMQNIFETATFEGAATNIGEADIKVGQNQEHCLEEAEDDCNLTMLVEETTLNSIETCIDAKEARVELNEDIDENQSNSSNEEILLDKELNVEASQIPSTSEWKPSSFKEEGVKSIHSNLKESQQVSMTMEEKEANGISRKVKLEKKHLKKLDEAKEREREREKEKLAVERAIREARERAFADARERAALERAAAEARQKNISDRQERLGKTTSQANEKTPAEKAAMEARLKAERAAVERATAEARARALERALSEKAASEARNKSDRSVAEKCVGSSRDNGMKPNFHSKSFSHGEVRDSTDVFDGANCDSAQRCKARFERHQRIGERVAKALAEKNMRDRLVQKEQEERNRVAEALDADVRRWSSGKAGNLRALLSTLQYILGPDSGWQPIPLTDIVAATAVKKAYRKATLFVHPDKLQQRGASIQQKYICEKVFDLLKEAWNRFNMEER